MIPILSIALQRFPIRSLRNHLILFSVVACSKKIVNATPDGPPRPAAGQTRIDRKGIEQVYVPVAVFLMGTSEGEAEKIIASEPPWWAIRELPSEQPKHEVRLAAGYWIDKYEVTNMAFQVFVNHSGYHKTAFWSENGKTWLSTKSTNSLPSNTGWEVATHPRVNIT